jgi:hypothetical protein
MAIKRYVARLLRHSEELKEAVNAGLAAPAEERGTAVNAAIGGCRDVDKLYGAAFVEAENRGPTTASMVRQLRRLFDHLGDAAGQAVIHGESLSDQPAFLLFNSLADELLGVLEVSPAGGAGNKPLENQPPLTDVDVKILQALQKKSPVLVELYELELDKDVSLTRRTSGPRVAYLLEHGLVARPLGERKGVTITQKGRDLLSTLPH